MDESGARRDAIMDIVTTMDIGTQVQLKRALEARGLKASQASISRDVRTLGLVKKSGRFAIGVLKELGDPANLIRDELREVISVDRFLLLKTKIGLASAVAQRIDNLNIPDVLGTIAGVDTVLVAARGREARQRLKRNLQALIARERPVNSSR